MANELRVEGFSELMARLDALKKQDKDKMLLKALREGAKVFQAAEENRAPERPLLPSGTALPRGALRSDVRIAKVPGQPVLLVGPGKYTAQAARWVEYGHRLVRGGYSKLLKSGKTRGPGSHVADVPAYPYIRPAYEVSIVPALNAVKASLEQSVKTYDKRTGVK